MTLDKNKLISFINEESSFRIVFNELLPTRFKGKTSGELYLYRKKIFNKYYPLFEDYFNNNPTERFSRKVDIIFIHHFESEREVRDPDNFDIKQILDILSSFLLRGDSLLHCKISIDGIMDSETFSEIIIKESN